jgi:hypothetical protein
MSLGRFILFILLLEAMVVQRPLIGNAGDRERAPEPRRSGISSMDLQEKGYAVSSPQETVHENGDIVSHYPPYYRPFNGGMRGR